MQPCHNPNSDYYCLFFFFQPPCVSISSAEKRRPDESGSMHPVVFTVHPANVAQAKIWDKISCPENADILAGYLPLSARLQVVDMTASTRFVSAHPAPSLQVKTRVDGRSRILQTAPTRECTFISKDPLSFCVYQAMFCARSRGRKKSNHTDAQAMSASQIASPCVRDRRVPFRGASMGMTKAH